MNLKLFYCSIPFTHEGFISRCSKVETLIYAAGLRGFKIPGTTCWTEYTHIGYPVPIPVTNNRNITGCSEVETLVQLHRSSLYPRYQLPLDGRNMPASEIPIPIPVTDNRNITGGPEVER